MHSDQKKVLTQAEQRENNIFLKIKDLARDKKFGTLKCVIKFHEGHVVEVRPEVMIAVIR